MCIRSINIHDGCKAVMSMCMRICKQMCMYMAIGGINNVCVWAHGTAKTLKFPSKEMSTVDYRAIFPSLSGNNLKLCPILYIFWYTTCKIYSSVVA